MGRNLTMMTDLYQLTMMNGYYLDGTYKNEAIFDMFFRYKEKLNYTIFAGLEQVIEYINNLHFSAEDIEYLRSQKIFDEGFLNYLKDFKFTGDIYSVREGEVVFAHEPIMIVKAPLIEAQLVETALLNIVCHQTLIATKAARIVNAAGEKSVVEFGLRRAQGPDAGNYGSRASIIGGCKGTSNVLAGQLFDIAIKGTHAHSWVMSYRTELEAFEHFAKIYPDNCLLLIDTYNTLESGLPNAIKVFKDLRAKGHKPVGVRLDSGDLAYLSKKVRKALDAEGFEDTIIFASGDIDENIITSLKLQGAKIDVYGVGTKLITSEDVPSLGGVYKLSRIEVDGKAYDRMKVSSSLEKRTNPGFKKICRLYNTQNGMAMGDLIALREETLSVPLTMTHEHDRLKKTTFEKYEARELHVKVFEKGNQVYTSPSLVEIRDYAQNEMDKFWCEYKRMVNPHIYKVDISDRLYALKQEFLSGVKSNELQ